MSWAHPLMGYALIELSHLGEVGDHGCRSIAQGGQERLGDDFMFTFPQEGPRTILSIGRLSVSR